MYWSYKYWSYKINKQFTIISENITCFAGMKFRTPMNTCYVCCNSNLQNKEFKRTQRDTFLNLHYFFFAFSRGASVDETRKKCLRSGNYNLRGYKWIINSDRLQSAELRSSEWRYAAAGVRSDKLVIIRNNWTRSFGSLIIPADTRRI